MIHDKVTLGRSGSPFQGTDRPAMSGIILFGLLLTAASMWQMTGFSL